MTAVVSTPYEELSEASREQLKIRVFDTLGCAIGARDAGPYLIMIESRGITEKRKIVAH